MHFYPNYLHFDLAGEGAEWVVQSSVLLSTVQFCTALMKPKLPSHITFNQSSMLINLSVFAKLLEGIVRFSQQPVSFRFLFRLVHGAMPMLLFFSALEWPIRDDNLLFMKMHRVEARRALPLWQRSSGYLEFLASSWNPRGRHRNVPNVVCAWDFALSWSTSIQSHAIGSFFHENRAMEDGQHCHFGIWQYCGLAHYKTQIMLIHFSIGDRHRFPVCLWTVFNCHTNRLSHQNSSYRSQM